MLAFRMKGLDVLVLLNAPLVFTPTLKSSNAKTVWFQKWFGGKKNVYMYGSRAHNPEV